MTYTRLHDACLHKDTNLAVDLCQKFPHETSMVDDHGYTPLHIACFGNPSMDVVLALIEASRYVAGLDKDIHGNTPLHIAVSQKDVSVDVVTKLLELFPTSLSSVNKEGMTPLHMACRHNASASGVIEALVSAYPAALKIRTKMGELAPRRKKSSSISSVDSFGSENDSNQHFVTDTAYKSYLNSLENWSGVLNVQVRDGSYPLHMAITAGASRHAIEMLVMACPEVLKMTDKHGRTPLYIYLTKGWFVDDEEMVKILLPEDDNAVARIPETRSGNLPLHAVAMYGGSLQVVKRVIDGYPDAVLAQNINKKTPYDLAMEYNQCPEDALAQLNAV